MIPQLPSLLFIDGLHAGDGENDKSAFKQRKHLKREAHVNEFRQVSVGAAMGIHSSNSFEIEISNLITNYI